MAEETCVYLGNECEDRMGLSASLIRDSSRNETLQSAMKVREKERADQPWIEKILTERWGGLQVIAHDEIFDAHLLPALIAGEKDGLATFRVQQIDQSKVAELITLDALLPQQGVGTALIEALVSKLRDEMVVVLRVTTTNDNLNALRFYQRRGFRLAQVRPGAVDKARFIKPSISRIGEYGIPIRDEIDLEYQVCPAGK